MQPASKAPISALVLTYNSAATLDRCLASLQFVDHVLVLDCGSKDSTQAIAGRWGADLVQRPWQGFTQQRNAGLDLCKHDWVLIVDSDEALTAELAAEIAELFRKGPDCEGYLIPERVRFYGRWLRWGGIYPGHHLTLFNRTQGSFEHRNGSDVHESVQVRGPVKALKGFKLHYAYPSFRQALEKINRYSELEAEGRARAGRRPRLYGLTWRPIERILKNYFLKLGFLDGVEGLLYCFLTALYQFSIEAKLFGLTRTHGPETKAQEALRAAAALSPASVGPVQVPSTPDAPHRQRNAQNSKV